MVLAFSDSEEHIFNKVVTALSGEQGIEYVSVPSNTVPAFPHLEIRLKEQTVYLDHTLIPMTYHEFFTLAYLAQRPGWVFSKEQIYEEVWKESGTNCRAAVTNVVSQIRRKIGEGYIRTVVGSGYKFEA